MAGSYKCHDVIFEFSFLVMDLNQPITDIPHKLLLNGGLEKLQLEETRIVVELSLPIFWLKYYEYYLYILRYCMKSQSKSSHLI